MIDQRIKERFAAAVRWGREVAKEEEALREVEHRLRKARLALQASKDDLIGLLPISSNTRVRLSFALSTTATAEAILESISQ
jgi:hypothetical protein